MVVWPGDLRRCALNEAHKPKGGQVDQLLRHVVCHVADQQLVAHRVGRRARHDGVVHNLLLGLDEGRVVKHVRGVVLSN